jgi:hypothetical protein
MLTSHVAKPGILVFRFVVVTGPATAQDRYFNDFDGAWDDPFAWEGGVVSSRLKKGTSNKGDILLNSER